MEEKNKVIEKIKKLLNLGNKTNFEGESQKALAAAMKLAAGIGMTVDEITLEDKEEENKIDQNLVYKPKSMFQTWERTIAAGIADALGCILIYRHRKGLACFVLVGTKADAILFNWLYPYIMKQLSKLCSRDFDYFGYGFPSKFVFQRSWYKGAAQRVIRMAREKFKEDTTQAEQEQYALVVADKKSRCENFINNNMNVEEKESKERKFDKYAASLGYRSGSEVNMGRPLAENKNLTEIGG